MDTVNLTIDNKTVVVKKGTTILEAASGIGIAYSYPVPHETR